MTARPRIRGDRLAIAAIVLLVPVRIDYIPVSIGACLSLVALPTLARGLRGKDMLFPLGFWCCASFGILLSLWTSRGGRYAIDGDLLIAQASVVVFLGLIALVVACGTRFLGIRTCAFLFSSGLLVDALMNSPSDGIAWKYQLAWPITIIALCLCSRWIHVALALAGLALVSAHNDYRSFIGIAFVSLIVALRTRVVESTSCERKEPGGTTTYSIGRTLVFTALVGVASLVAMSVVTWLALAGRLGADAATRTSIQTQGGGSMWGIMSGRYEWGAALSLFERSPLGYGFGIRLNASDIFAAKQGLAEVGAGTSGPYVDGYMFGHGIELHSITSDLWAGSGWVGLGLGFAAFFVLVRTMMSGSAPTSRGIIAFACTLSVWDLMFSPILPNGVYLAAVLGWVAATGGRHGDRAGLIREGLSLHRSGGSAKPAESLASASVTADAKRSRRGP